MTLASCGGEIGVPAMARSPLKIGNKKDQNYLVFDVFSWLKLPLKIKKGGGVAGATPTTSEGAYREKYAIKTKNCKL